MMTPFLLLLGPLCGMALVINSPEEVLPAQTYVRKAVFVSLLLAETLIAFALLGTSSLVVEMLTVLLLSAALAATYIALLRHHMLIHQSVIWIGAVLSGHILIIALAMLSSALAIIGQSADCVKKETLGPLRKIFSKASSFIIPFIAALLTSIVF